MDNKSINKISGRKNVLEYIPPDSIMLDLPYILIDSKNLCIGKSYVILNKEVRGASRVAVKLLDFDNDEDIVYLIVQELLTNNTYTIPWYLNGEGDYWIWEMSDVEGLIEILPIKS